MSDALERVSFRRPVEHRPRLSPRYVPGRTHERYWSEAELQVLRDHYGREGPAFCVGLLSNRSLTTVYQTARKLGLAAPENVGKERSRWRGRAEEYDAAIAEAWPGLSGRGAVTRFAQELGVPRWVVSKRAAALGLAKPHSKEPPWTAAELRLLREVPLHSPDIASRHFRERGFARTATSIVMKAKREGLSRRYRETLSATAVARVLGVDGKTVTRWIILGELSATKRETDRLPQQGGDPWSVDRETLCRYILDNLATIDLRKVEKFGFVEILTGGQTGGRVR